MTLPLLGLLGFAVWTLVLVTAVGLWRWVFMLKGERKITEFPSGVQHGTDPYWRLNRAHANCTENLPIAAAVILSGVAAGVDAPLFGTLAVTVAGLRVVQSCAHVSSGGAAAIGVRATAYFSQLICLLVMAGLVAMRLLPT